MTSQGFVRFDDQGRQLLCHGEWKLANLPAIQKELATLPPIQGAELAVNGAAISDLDSAGGWLLVNWLKKVRSASLNAHLTHFSEQQQKLLSLIEKSGYSLADLPAVEIPSGVASLGYSAVSSCREALDYLYFVGKLTCEAFASLRHPLKLRWSSLAWVVDKTGYRALPIIALLSFMVGVVISYQMGNQLRNYGANVFIVDLLGLSVLREFGPLITSIMVAGRTGSAYTAQLGMMKINQEIDALDTMGVPPDNLLMLPRLLGLMIALPLLTIWADVFGVMGGMLMASSMLGIKTHAFLLRFGQTIPLRALLIGLGKAPVFALLIASIGCFQGTQVSGNAESVGMRTTRSVVLAIFFIIIADAIFSVLFSRYKL